MNRLLKIVLSFFVLCIFLFSNMVCMMSERCDQHYAIDDIRLRVVQMEGPHYTYSNTPDTTGKLVHYYNLTPETEIHDSLAYGIFITTGIVYCNHCRQFTASALSLPGTEGTKQIIKSLHLFLTDNSDNSQKEITGLFHGNGLLKAFHWNSTERDYGGTETCATNDCSVFTSSSFSDLKTFQAIFNSNKWEIYNGGSNLIFFFNDDAIKSFPPDFSISMEIEFANGKKVSSITKCLKK